MSWQRRMPGFKSWTSNTRSHIALSCNAYKTSASSTQSYSVAVQHLLHVLLLFLLYMTRLCCLLCAESSYCWSAMHLLDRRLFSPWTPFRAIASLHCPLMYFGAVVASETLPITLACCRDGQTSIAGHGLRVKVALSCTIESLSFMQNSTGCSWLFSLLQQAVMLAIRVKARLYHPAVSSWPLFILTSWTRLDQCNYHEFQDAAIVAC